MYLYVRYRIIQSENIVQGARNKQNLYEYRVSEMAPLDITIIYYTEK